jgi:hypothetical protein
MIKKSLGILFLFVIRSLAVDVTIPNITESEGKKFTLAITSTDLTAGKVFSCDFTLIYNSALLAATDVQASGTLLANWGAPTVNISAGQLRFSCGGTQALSSSGTLIKINFQVASGAVVGSSTAMVFSSFIFNEGVPTVAAKNGVFTVIADTQPPRLTAGPSVGSITSKSAILQWTTDEVSTSTVEYGETTAYGLKSENSSLVTSHAVTLTGLKAGKTYHCRVASKDKAGNGPTNSSDQTFTTQSITVQVPDLALDPGADLLVPLTISDLTDQNVTDIVFTLRYDARILSAAGVSSEDGLAASWPLPAFSTSSGNVQIRLNGSTPLTSSGTLLKIKFSVAATAAIGQKTDLEIVNLAINQGALPATARKGSFTVRDTRPPQITSGPVVEYISTTTAVISWVTNEKANSVIRFGATANYGRTASLAQLSTPHQLELVGLSANSLYHYRVSSQDSSGNGPAESEDKVFTTRTANGIPITMTTIQGRPGQTIALPVNIGNSTSLGVGSYAMAIAFDSGVLELQSVRRNSNINPTWSAFHYELFPGQVIISDAGKAPLTGSGELFSLMFLIKGSVFNTDSEVRFQHCTFNSGTPEAAPQNGIVQITGNPDIKAPAITAGPYIDQITINSARVTWYTDEPADSRLEYGTTASYGQTANSTVLQKIHQMQITGLAAGKVYHVRAGARDRAGNGPTWSGDLVLTTLSVNGISVTVPEVHATAGSTIDVVMQTGNLSSQEVYALYLIMSYDPSLLTATAVTSSGTLTSTWGDPTFTLSSGRLVVAMGGIKALAGSGALLKIRFALKNTAMAGTRTPLVMEKFTFNEGRPTTSLGNGMLLVDDIVAPKISGGPIAFAITSSSGQLLWSTDEPSNALVEFGESIPYDRSLQDRQLETRHAVSLLHLKENTLYHYRVGGADSSANGPTWSSDQTFRTTSSQGVVIALPDTITGLAAKLVLPVRLANSHSLTVQDLECRIDFKASLFSFSTVSLENTIATGWTATQVLATDSTLQFTLSGPGLIKSGNLAFINGLVKPTATSGQSGSLVFTKAIVNKGQITADAQNGHLTVLNLTKPAFIKNPNTQDISAQAATINWQSNKKCRSQLHYGLTTNYGSLIERPQLAEAEHITLTGLAAKTSYHFRVGLWDSLGQGPVWSSDAVFTTAAESAFSLGVVVPDTSAMQASTLALPIRITTVSGMGIRTVSFDFMYSAADMSPTGLATTSTMSQGWTQSISTASAGKLAVRLEGTTDLAGSGILAQLLLKINESATVGKTTALTLENIQFNNGQLKPTNVRNGILTILAAAAQDPVRISIPDTSVWPQRTVVLPVRVADTQKRVLSEWNLSIQVNPAIMTITGIDTAAAVLGGWPELSTTLTSGQIQIKAKGNRSASRDGVLLYVRTQTQSWLTAGQSSSVVFKEASVAPASIPVQRQDGIVRISKRPDALWGRAIHATTSNGLDSATVALADKSGKTMQQITDKQGYFSFIGLSTTQTYSIKIDRSGFVQQTALSGLSSGSENIVVKMEPLAGVLAGIVTDDKGRAVVQALVVADNGAGSFASASTDSSGRFVLQGLLKTTVYQIRLSKFGFVDLTMSHNADGSTLQIHMQVNYATLAGRVVQQDSSAAADVEIHVLESSSSQILHTVKTDASGWFRLPSVRAGECELTASKAGYISEPEQMHMSIGPGQSYSVRFTMLVAKLDHISLQGPDQVANHLTTRYSYIALTASGKQLSLSDVQWSLTPALAGTILNGVLQPNNTFIGEAMVGVQADKGAVTATQHISLYGQVDINTQRTFLTATGASISVQAGCFQDVQQLKFEEIELSALKRDSRNATAIGAGFKFLPESYALFKPVTVFLPGLKTATENAAGLWDKESAEWRLLNNVRTESNGLYAETEQLGTFAVLQPSGPLAIQDLKFLPNPFSPDVDSDLDGRPGLTIQLAVTSRNSRMPLVTVQVYSMDGRLIRTLMENQPVAKARTESIYWDGLSEQKLLARNGRYLIKVTVKDGQGSVERLSTVVLIR